MHRPSKLSVATVLSVMLLEFAAGSEVVGGRQSKSISNFGIIGLGEGGGKCTQSS